MRLEITTFTLGLLLTVSAWVAQDPDNRLAHDIRRLKDSNAQPKGPSWIAALADSYLLAVLTNTDANTLRAPKLVVPILGIKSNDVMLAVFWIEKQPSVSGVELIGGDGEKHVLAIPEAYKIENEKDARDSVIFRSVYRWQDSDMSPVLKGNCKARLMCAVADTNAMTIITRKVK